MTEMSPVNSRFREHQSQQIDFWISGYVKFKMLQLYPHIVSDLKDAIRIGIQEIPITMVCAAVLSTICRMQHVIVFEGVHVENL